MIPRQVVEVTSPRSTSLQRILRYVDQHERGKCDAEELTIDTLTELRAFARIHAVDFERALDTSAMHAEAERVGKLDGN